MAMLSVISDWLDLPLDMAIRRFEEIEGWQLARNLANSVYNLTDAAPFSRD